MSVRPRFCCIAATDYCMLRCQMCNKWFEPLPRPDQVPSIADWKDFLTQFFDLVEPGFEMDFGGGEALSMVGLFDLTKHAKELGYTTTIASNGWLIDKEMAKKIADAGIDAISLSLDSPTPELHDNIRGVDGVYDRVMEAIDNLTRYAPQVRKGLCFTIMDTNFHMMYDMVKLADDNPHIDWLYFMAVVQPNYSGDLKDEGQEETPHGSLWPHDVEAVARNLDEIIQLKKEKKTKVSNEPAHLRAYKAYFLNSTAFVNQANCKIGSRAISVNAYGDIQLCFFKGFIGNIRRDDIRQLWESQQAAAVRNDVEHCKTNCHLLLNCCYISDEEDADVVRG